MIGSVICGTHRPQDLIPAFENVLTTLAKNEGYRASALGFNVTLAHAGTQLTTTAFDWIPECAREDEESAWWCTEAPSHAVEDLMDVLTACAPADYYFGAHPEDGSDFGFWKSEEEE